MGGILVDYQPLADVLQKFQGMKLPLVLKGHSPKGGEGQRQVFFPLCRKVQGLQGGQLVFQSCPVRSGINMVFPVLPAAISVLCQCSQGRYGLFVGIQIQPCLLSAKLSDQLVVDQTMLGCDLRSGILGDAPADVGSFCHDAVDSG